MRVTIMQRDIEWADPAKNLARAEAAMLHIPADTDLIVLPEMFATGFITDPTPHRGQCVSRFPRLNPSSESLSWMRHIAAERGCAVAGSVAIQCDESYRNRFYFVKPDGSAAFYDKRHLFTYGGEDKHYTAGTERTVVEWRGVRFLLMVCYDLRFPIWSRNNEDYDAAIYVASWPTPRIQAWQTLLHARAIENQCFVIGVNRVGSDPNCDYSGGSVIIDAKGRDLAACPLNEESTATATLDMDALRAFREKFPVLNDRDEYIIKM